MHGQGSFVFVFRVRVSARGTERWRGDEAQMRFYFFGAGANPED
jgi:hypothetical protein